MVCLTLFLTSCKTGDEIVNNPPVTPDSGASKPVATDITCWLTCPDKSIYFQRQNIALNFQTVSNSYPSIQVDTTQTYQSMDGFGFALTGGSAYLINKLDANSKQSLIKELFSSDSTHIGISYLRISIGASDLNSYVFTYDDIATSLTDTTLQYFSLKPDSYDLIPVLQSIVKQNPNIKIIATPWTAPAWMKTNNNYVGGNLRTDCYNVYSRYFVKYIQSMKELGLTIDAITPQNEPLNPYNNPSMAMSAKEQSLFVKNYLGPAFKSANLSTKIIVYDHNCDVTSYPISILNDSITRKYVDGSAYHLYAGSIAALSSVHNLHPDKNIYFTEQWVGAPSNFKEDLKWHTRNLIIGATHNWSKNVIEWNLASDPTYNPHTTGGCTTCLGALTIGASITRNVSYYVIAHASKFVKPGSYRIESNEVNYLPNVAFKTSTGNKVLIVLNDSSNPQTFNILFNKKSATTTIPAESVATYVW